MTLFCVVSYIDLLTSFLCVCYNYHFHYYILYSAFEWSVHGTGFLLSVAIAGTINPKAGTTYHVQPVAESLRITDHWIHQELIYNVIVP